jgi:tetratricopeptide (TPR) repeat protein
MSQHPPLPRLDEILARAEAGYRKTALADLRRYVGLNPDNLEAWLALGRLEDSPRAQKRALSRALALDPLNEEALRLYEALLEENPKLARRSYWRELGVGVLAGLVLLSLAVTAFLIFSSTRGEGSVVLVPTSRIVTSTVAPLQAVSYTHLTLPTKA